MDIFEQINTTAAELDAALSAFRQQLAETGQFIVAMSTEQEKFDEQIKSGS